MSWSVTLGRLFGSEIRIHLTFLLLLAWIGVVYYRQGGAAAAIDGVLFVITVFACVTLHELGHALAARRYGIRTPDITLLPIGGVARLERMPEDPVQEIIIALAGPAVNVVIAGLLVLLFSAQPDLGQAVALSDPGPTFAARLAAVNVFLVLFNLIPAFPMDGGRVLRAALALRMSRMKATAVAARVGQVLAFGFAALGIMGGNFMLVLIAVFVFLAASAETEGTSLMTTARRLRVRDAMISAFEALGPQSTLDDAAKVLLRTTQHEFPVVDGAGKLRGMLTRKGLVAALAANGPDMPVIEAMETDIPLAPENARLDKALDAMQVAASNFVAVAGSDGRFTGYVSRENLAELNMLTHADWAATPRHSP
ncbi:site-2 protease family protein [Tepidamorphus sp. 3E244]|uniref:site-2 protease family protein n=1 Tax=Tepidamorphus sp. 3E244 TaxID=3385498 RepID=UPI0038FD0447